MAFHPLLEAFDLSPLVDLFRERTFHRLLAPNSKINFTFLAWRSGPAGARRLLLEPSAPPYGRPYPIIRHPVIRFSSSSQAGNGATVTWWCRG
jgi:hypothetical protein